MDRRQRKTREAIFDAFIALLAEKPCNAITVGEIIERADIGRATFYAHFETKDFLLKELCEELFGHIADTAAGDCGVKDESVFLHLLHHLEKNDRHMLALLASENNGIFLHYFKTELKKLVRTHLERSHRETPVDLPEEFLVNHMAATFVETVDFWLRHGRRETPEELNRYFELAVADLL